MVPNTIKVYIAGPYSTPDPCVNTHEACRIAGELVKLEFVPCIPHLTHFWHTMEPRPYTFWLAYDLNWLHVCDVVLRFPGASSGADKEIIEANKCGIPVFYTIRDLCRAYGVIYEGITDVSA